MKCKMLKFISHAKCRIYCLHESLLRLFLGVFWPLEAKIQNEERASPTVWQMTSHPWFFSKVRKKNSPTVFLEKWENTYAYPTPPSYFSFQKNPQSLEGNKHHMQSCRICKTNPHVGQPTYRGKSAPWSSASSSDHYHPKFMQPVSSCPPIRNHSAPSLLVHSNRAALFDVIIVLESASTTTT